MEGDLIAYMLTSSALVALVGDRIWPVSRPSNSALPAVTVTRISGAPAYADDGEVGIFDARIQVDVWGSNYGVVAGVSDVLINHVSAAADVIQGSTTFIFITIDDKRDLREGGLGQAEYLFRKLIDLAIVYKGV